MDNYNFLDLENILDEVTQFVYKGLDVNNLEKQQKEELYCLVELMSKLTQLKQKSNRGKLDRQDLQILNRAYQVVFKYHHLIAEILRTNNRKTDSDEWIP